MLPAVGFSAKAVTAEAALALAPVLSAGAANTVATPAQPTCDNSPHEPWRNTWGTIERIDRNRQLSMRDMRGLPESIRSKKSWSPAFKMLISTQQEKEMDKLRLAMESDKTLAKKVWNLLEGKA